MRNVGIPLALVAMVAADLLPESRLSAGVRYLALGYLTLDFLFRLRVGYSRRRPYWTQESWRRYLVACSVPVGALLLMAGMMVALEWKMSFVGAARLAVRGVWVGSLVICLLVGVAGLSVALDWLTTGEASRQFALPRWLGGQRDRAA